MGPVSRFLRLERRRPQRAPALPQPAVHRQRFEPAPAPALEVSAPEPLSAQPFVRCAFCEHDNSRFDARCANCSAALGSDEQRAFNERLWRARQEERAAEEAALAKLHAPPPPPPAAPDDEDDPLLLRLWDWLVDWL